MSRERLWDFAHLLVLSAFALAQPILDIFGSNPTFFAVRGSTRGEIVLFGLVVTFALPLALFVVELAVGLVSGAAARVVHLVFVGGLFAVIALHVLTKTETAAGRAALGLATAVGVAGARLYRTRAGRTFLSFLAPAPIVFLLLFLLDSPVSRLVLPTQAEAKATTVAVDARTPVVLIVFDELQTAALFDRNGRIDARRWPNFAALARNSTWFRNATTVSAHTEQAVPAILDGKLPNQKLLPILADHPQNLFTWLGGSYRLEVEERETHLCPRNLCVAGKRTASATTHETPPDEVRSLASDVGIVYLHLVLPQPYASDLPPISTTWGNFARTEQAEEETVTSPKPSTTVPACERGFCSFADRIAKSPQPALYFMHALVPHVPWRFLPSGKHYGGDVRLIPGVEEGRWSSDTWLVAQAQQRYLLQLGYTDRGLGLIMNRLRAAGLYERSLVIVTGDHGETFRASGLRRNVTQESLADIAFVPLFVKRPGQRRGRIDDSLARTVDILPTIAQALAVKLPWRVDGKPLIGRELPADGTIALVDSGGRLMTQSLRGLSVQRANELARQHSLFGTGSLERVYRIGPHPELIGKGVGALDVRAGSGARVELNGAEMLEAVDLSTSLLPNYVTGSVAGPQGQRQALAVAVNGTIRAVTWSYADRGRTRFGALVPERAIRAGANDVRVFAVRESGGHHVLDELSGSRVTFVLVGGSHPTITSSQGTKIPVRPGALEGEVKVRTPGESVEIGGWAANLRAKVPVTSIVVFVEGRSVYRGRPGNMIRNDIVKRYGIKGAGFLYQLPSSMFPAWGREHTVRVFALSGGVASELRYRPVYPWSH